MTTSVSFSHEPGSLALHETGKLYRVLAVRSDLGHATQVEARLWGSAQVYRVTLAEWLRRFKPFAEPVLGSYWVDRATGHLWRLKGRHYDGAPSRELASLDLLGEMDGVRGECRSVKLGDFVAGYYRLKAWPPKTSDPLAWRETVEGEP